MPEIELELTTDFSNAARGQDPAAAPHHGGRIAQLVVGSLAQAGERLPVRSASFRYLAPAAYGPVVVKLEQIQSTKSGAQYTAAVLQNGELKVCGHVGVGGAGSEPARHPRMPDAPRPQDCPGLTLPPAMYPRFTDKVDFRLVASPPLLSGDHKAEHCVWMRLKDGAIGDTTLAFLCDCMYPTFFIAARDFAATATSDYSIYWSGEPDAAPIPDWVLAKFTMLDWTGKWSCEDGIVWSSDGRLLALSRQLRRIFAAAPR